MRALEIFYELCEIPHASSNTKQLKDFIINHAQKHHCKVESDSAGNIHIIKGKPRFCLQAHYDMVLIGTKITPFIENDTLKARDSSLGADNGAGVACILALLESVENIEALITNDEEIGMIGANNIKLDIVSDSIINLDSEELSEIIVGCAGGFDADITIEGTHKPCNMKYFYTLEARNFRGGHSGIDIDKNVPNAIVELLWKIHELDCEVVSIEGGEKRNSIPVSTRAIIASNEKYAESALDSSVDSDNATFGTPNSSSADSSAPHIALAKCDSIHSHSFSKHAFTRILQIHNGVHEVKNNCVVSSLNISMIDTKSAKLMIRANKSIYLSRHAEYLKMIFGKNIAFSGHYTPWERGDSALLETMKNAYKKHKIDFSVKEIHAGLECGILQKNCKIKNIISIGPTIKNPHSKQESMNLESFRQFFEILKSLV